MNPVILITGPTASGKSALALRLAEWLDGEIVSADSMQIYRGMDIGTAKATPAERARVVHHLLDIREPGEPFSVVDYQREASAAIRQIQTRGKTAVLCGGTGQYLSALTDGLTFASAGADPAVRAELEQLAARDGSEALWQKLAALDPASAGRIQPGDKKRLVRALEVSVLTGRPMSEHLARSRDRAPEFAFNSFCLNHDRPELYRRIDQRVRDMVERGLVEEVRALLARPLPAGSTCLQAIGYKELAETIAGSQPLSEAVARIQQATRRYAKRQLTWFRKMKGLIWLENMGADDAICHIKSVMNENK
ncbi:MAG: tRNA (adenosine(37)-N6)-dimethylallyltransferase MiaA [Clostridiaceae bacterium]|jgi:tRNA dimethylallyltransferase|nr:tRNA (adenosine(37)-N6)-dimethylallyltransferase MiaA [Clostridiaceae bacterium]